jgi:hypothetical protein
MRSPHDPLIALWQTAPQPDTHHLLRDLQRLNRLHWRLKVSVRAILAGLTVLFIFEEATGRVSTHGALSIAWILIIAIRTIRCRHARCNRSDAFTQDSVSLLKFMLARAKSDLFIARCLYAGVPCGAVAGFVVAKIAGLGASPSARAVHPLLQWIQTGAGIAALIVMTVTGAVLARSRRLQVQEFSEKLKSIEEIDDAL